MDKNMEAGTGSPGIPVVQVKNQPKVLGFVVELEYIPIKELTGMVVDQELSLAYLPELTPEPLCMVSLGDCTDESRIENRELIHTVKLTARIKELPYNLCGTENAVVFRTVDNSRYIIGGVDKPYPVITAVQNFPGDVQTASGYTLTVEYQSAMGVLLIR